MKALAALLLLAAAPALGQERPLMVPTRDVTVVYQVNAGPQPIEERWRFDAADQLGRIDIGNVYMVSNLRSRTATMVSDQERKAFQVPMPDLNPAGLSGMNFIRLGALTVAGVPCTEWQTTDSNGQAVVACVSADGVMLRARRGGQVAVEATAVTYARQDPAVFAVPSGYTRAMPNVPQ